MTDKIMTKKEHDEFYEEFIPSVTPTAKEEKELYQFLDEYHNKLSMITDVNLFRKKLLKIFNNQNNKRQLKREE